MQYLLLINKPEERWRALSDDERTQWMARYEAHGKKMLEAGVMRGGAFLEPARSATTVRVRDGKKLLTDGPFAETEEQVAGAAIIEVENLDEALAWASSHPDAEWGSVEVRPVIPWDK
jgi:hypothetical protein